ncbi:hypothetical protein [Streptomyces sp. NPDC088557]|uniref:hypothetical protein n=1 Tax=Streptomyces sp. NPDC088557 TaxID=3365867 RepID=UPI003817D71A
MQTTENTEKNAEEGGSPPFRELGPLRTGILIGATVPMLVVGGLGAWGTFTNIKTEFPRNATALGVVVAGEGGTLILALVMVLVTLLGQSSPRMVRLGLWLLPLVAAATGAVVADDVEERMVYAVTPLAMIAASEGLGLIARRVVIYCTRVDAEARRRNAATMQRLAVLRALAANHPKEGARKRAELASWRLVRKVGVGDDDLGAGLVSVQRDRLGEGADTALATMFGLPVTAAVPALAGSVTPALEPGARNAGSVTPAGPLAVTEPAAGHGADTLSGGVVTQVSGAAPAGPSHPAGTVTGTDSAAVTPPVTETGMVPVTNPVSGMVPVTDTVTDGGAEAASVTPSVAPKTTVTLQEVAAVAGVPVPETGERLTDEQLLVVLRHLRYRDDPPTSYRQAVADFRDAGFVGGEERIRRTWGELMSREESDAGQAAKETDAAESGPSDEDANADEEDEEAEEEAGPKS